MANKYDYEPAYPLNLEAGSTETPLTASQKIKAEFERLYRIVNNGLEYIDQMVEKMETRLAEFDEKVTELINTIKQKMAELDTKLEDFRKQITDFVNQKFEDAGVGGECTVTIVQSSQSLDVVSAGTSTQTTVVYAGDGSHTSTFKVKYGNTINVSSGVTHTGLAWVNGVRYYASNGGTTVSFAKSNLSASASGVITVLENIQVAGNGFRLVQNDPEGPGGGGN